MSKGKAVAALFEGDERIPCNFYETAGIPATKYDSFLSRNSGIPHMICSVSGMDWSDAERQIRQL